MKKLKSVFLLSVFMLSFHLGNGQDNGYPLCILKKDRPYALTLLEKRGNDESNIFTEVFLDKGDFFLGYRISFVGNTGSEYRRSYVVHCVPLENGRYKLETIKMSIEEYRNGKLFERQHPTIKWLEWTDEGFSDESSLPALVLKYYLSTDGYPNTIETTLDRVNSWDKSQLEQYEKNPTGKRSATDTTITDETRNLIDETRKILKKLGAEMVWNKDLKEYEAKW